MIEDKSDHAETEDQEETVENPEEMDLIRADLTSNNSTDFFLSKQRLSARNSATNGRKQIKPLLIIQHKKPNCLSVSRQRRLDKIGSFDHSQQSGFETFMIKQSEDTNLSRL